MEGLKPQRLTPKYDMEDNNNPTAQSAHIQVWL
jgi:hypothetical protein